MLMPLRMQVEWKKPNSELTKLTDIRFVSVAVTYWKEQLRLWKNYFEFRISESWKCYIEGSTLESSQGINSLTVVLVNQKPSRNIFLLNLVLQNLASSGGKMAQLLEKPDNFVSLGNLERLMSIVMRWYGFKL